MRIDKLISECGIASRKEAALAAKKGGVTVNGEPVKDLSRHVDPKIDKVTYLGRAVEYEQFVYVMLNKPEGYVSATDDPGLPVVTELLSSELRKRGLFPVGRLDRDTVGLMILTNNGPLSHALLAPKNHVAKSYRFECAEPLDERAELIFREGITLGDGYVCKSAELSMDEGRTSGIITLTEGKYHQIKRMMGAMSNRIVFLERVSFGGIELDRTLQRGEWRYLTPEEIKLIER